MSQHELLDFLKRTNEDIEREYERISWRVSEDPGTAGDQGEENWKKLLKLWLPSGFEIVTKGRILGTNGNASPQLDVIVLSPDYPKQLIDCKLYLAGGVVAAFECKTTLKTSHIKKLMETSKCITELSLKESGTPKKDLKRKIYYGLLAHSHEWKKAKSRPKKNIRSSIIRYDLEVIKHPIEMPDIVCVADVATWRSCKLVIPTQPDSEFYKDSAVRSTYIEANAEEDYYTPVGSMIFSLLEFLSWQHLSLRDIISYMRILHVEGSGHGTTRPWGMDVLSEETRNNIRCLKNGGLWDEWNLNII